MNLELYSSPSPPTRTATPQPAAFGVATSYGRQSPVLYKSWDGEKTAGGMGPINWYRLDHDGLAMRAWQMLLESDIVKIGIERRLMWTVGKGLQLRTQPIFSILSRMGVNSDQVKNESNDIEAFWSVYANSTMCSENGLQTLQQIVWESEKCAMLSGDCLYIINYENGIPKIAIKDGMYIKSPLLVGGNFLNQTNPETGNRVRRGIEIDAKGNHVAFYVWRNYGEQSQNVDEPMWVRIEAKDSYGNVRAFMYYGDKYRIDDIRGIPLLAVCMETVKQMDMYKDASIQAVVERAKVILTIEHEMGAIGDNPFDAVLARGSGINPLISDIPNINGTNIADTFAATFNRSVVNMGQGSKLNAVAPGAEVAFKDFFELNAQIVLAAIGIPQGVALMSFDSNYSASRAEIKDWEHTIEVNQLRIQKPCQVIYEALYLGLNLNNTVRVPKYLEAYFSKNAFALLAYYNSKWIGDKVPSIDEEKEAKATRILLGEEGAAAPLITIEDAMARHSTGEFANVATQFADEKKFFESRGIEVQTQLNKPQEPTGEKTKETKTKKKTKEQ